jgi:Ca-activated chloride channel family protein
MSFVWPQALLLLAAVPFVVAGYVALARRRDHRVAELAALGFAPSAAARRARRLRHIPFALSLVALALLVVAFARPEMSVGLPRFEGTVILAFDVSNSMLADDLEPTRMDAAKAAARSFVERQPDSVELGVVAFSDGGLVTQPPTTDRTEVLAAIDRLAPLGATSLGQGIFTSLNAIAGQPLVLDPESLADLDNADIGYYGYGAVVLLSDGENTSEPDPLALAELASVAGVRIYPIGIGSSSGAVVELDGFSVATALDEEVLTRIAEGTGGTYFRAEDTAALADIYESIDLRLTTEAEPTEVTAAVTGASIALLVLGAALSLLWFGRLV